MSAYTYTEKELLEKRYRCMDICPTWNREDHDCEIYGHQHPSPLNCPYFVHHIKRDTECGEINKNENESKPTSSQAPDKIIKEPQSMQKEMAKNNPAIVASFEETIQTGEYDWKNVLLTKICDDTTTIRELIEWAGKNLDRDYFEMKLTRGDR